MKIKDICNQLLEEFGPEKEISVDITRECAPPQTLPGIKWLEIRPARIINVNIKIVR